MFRVIWIDEPFWGGAQHERPVRGLHSAKRVARIVAGKVVDSYGQTVADYSEAK